MTGGSVTLTQIGFDDLLISGNHPWRNFKADLLAEKDPVKQSALRLQGTQAEYFLAVSMPSLKQVNLFLPVPPAASCLLMPLPVGMSSGWQAPKRSPRLWTRRSGRVREHVLPLEDQRQKNAGNKNGTFIGRILILEREPAYLRRNLTLILVNEVLGSRAISLNMVL